MRETPSAEEEQYRYVPEKLSEPTGFSTLQAPLLSHAVVSGTLVWPTACTHGKDKSLLEVQVMTTFHPLKLVTIILVIGLAAIPFYAQEQPGAQSGQSPSSGQSSAQSAQAQPQTFTGKIVKSKGGLALKDEASNTTYKLDNEDQAKQYAGKSVKVTGTMDPATNTIHVANIEMAAAGSTSPKQ